MALDDTTPEDGDGSTTGVKVSGLASAIRTLKTNLNSGDLQKIGNAGGTSYIVVNDDDTVDVYTAGVKVATVSNSGIFEGNFNVVSDITVSTACDYVDFTGLDGNSAIEYRLSMVLQNNGSGYTNHRIFINADYNITDYYRQNLLADDTTISGGRANDNNISYVNSGSVTRIDGTITIDSGNYVDWIESERRYRGSSLSLLEFRVITTFTVTNLTSIRIGSSIANGIGVGSRLILTKVKK